MKEGWNEKTELKDKLFDFCQNVLFHNLVIKLLSVFGALLVWLLITNIDDPYKAKTFLVPVELINEDALHSVNKVFEVIDGKTANVSVRGKRSIIDKLEADDILAIADLSELSSVNAVTIKAKLRKAVSSDVILQCSQVLKVSLEDMETKQVKVTVETEGTPEEGYTVSECFAKPNVIEVSGGESVMERVNSVRVRLNVNGASENFSKLLEPVAYDRKGNKIISSTLSFGTSMVKVRAKVLQNKTIPVKLSVKGNPLNGYEYIEGNCIPGEIEIVGNERKLAGISQLVIPIDITGLSSTSSNLEREISVEEYLPDDVMVVEEYKRISIKLVIEKLQEKTIEVPISTIRNRYLNDGLDLEIITKEQYVEFVIQGREAVLNSMTGASIQAYIDCSGLTEGRYALNVKAVLGSRCQLLKQPRVKVVIKKVKNNSQAEEDDTAVPAQPTPSVTPSPESTPNATDENHNNDNSDEEE